MAPQVCVCVCVIVCVCVFACVVGGCECEMALSMSYVSIVVHCFTSLQVYCPALKRKVDAIAFPYHRNGELVNVKYRALPKTFWQVGERWQLCCVLVFDCVRGLACASAHACVDFRK